MFAQDNELTSNIDIFAPLSQLQTLYLHNNSLVGKIPQSFDQMNNLYLLSVYNNALDRINTHHADVTHLDSTWLNRPGFALYTHDQRDIIPPTLTGTGAIDPFAILFVEYAISWNENSYAVNT